MTPEELQAIRERWNYLETTAWSDVSETLDDALLLSKLFADTQLALDALAAANARIAELEETNAALEMSVMDEDAIMTLGSISMDLERAESRIAALESQVTQPSAPRYVAEERDAYP